MNIRQLITVLAVLFSFTATRAFGQAPSNDNPCQATPLTVGTGCTYTQYTNLNATASTGVPVPGCGNYGGGDVWFTATVPASGSIVFDSQTGTMTDGALAVYTGTCGSLTLVGCDDDGSANGLMPSLTVTALTPGSTVYIRFWEWGNNNNGTFGLCAQSGQAPCTASNTNTNCTSADPFCTGLPYNYCNTTNVASLGGGGMYGCLGSTPNPAFYYLNVATSGPMNFTISQTANTGGGIDVDYIIWGPFTSQAAMCTGASATNIVSCSYSTAAVENASIPNAVAGQWYMVLITNFSNQPGSVQFSQTSGSGTASCNIMSANPGACTNGSYTLTGTVQTSTPPSTGTLTITTSCGGSVVLNAPFTNATNYSIPNLCGNGASCTATAVFSAAGAPPILTAPFTAPNCYTITATPTSSTCGLPNGSAAVSVSPTGTYSYAWSNGATTQNLSGVAAGTYTVTVTGAGGCSATQSVTVGSAQTAPMTVSVSPASTTVCPGGCVTLTGSATAPPTTATLSSSGSVPILDYQTVSSSIPVNNPCFSGAVTTGTITGVTLNITHTWDSDISITLVAPNGSQVVLSQNNGSSGQNYINTTFVNSGAPSITTGIAPFSGTYTPQPTGPP
ncbi:MAG TPA: proprotein convertase P-domain-containing protein, partial [Chitinophagales bacterium]|nr:proprotein convertase P-domain-containing protein [Chitinophagales bacterium]